MHSLYDVPAPAKLNLFLHITGRRPDGYHLLESVFMLLDWHDVLHFERTASHQISREDLSGMALPADDLITRAARALQQATGCTQGVHIGIHKNLPAQAGMGGGSSDAASTLIALNRLWNLGLTRQQLQAIGLTLGADVPFFLCGHSAWVSGIGEVITPLTGENALPEQQFVVIKPEHGLDTGKIFGSELLKRDTKPATIADFAAKHYGFGQNDLQPVAESLQPEVTQAINWLKSFKLHARMTGSGSAVFAPLTQTVDLNSAPRTWKVRICKNLEIHPLLSWVSDNKL
ncbi:4-(cytidine 5'-diphospho)-2-C-methyl-D-erythritol kinase [Comamonas testosteroni]|uniref:4-diphosphocytidyl-2-C-methyl-D-erythritol kinase n=1 Tax=Comamonas testosteroni TaxID=285 RepID=A0A373FR06_COMTE|nr:4-(cytidine 5'-diphospho)-2-C-methyl-D-erythritol kinase [Comamonas testosteroni]RGE46611.1 4-(cytidine 5'-diphospho)-2-C-methyl-D-erythritol kinase [Comamonas testosteroni]